MAILMMSSRFSMISAPRRRSGYSLIELVTVLAIVGVLAMVGGYMMLGDRRSTSVRTVMDQVEGVLMQAQKSAMASGQDITIAVNGTWNAPGTPALFGTVPFTLDARPFQSPTSAPNAYTGARVGSDSERFVSLFSQHERDHMHAGVATGDAGNGLAATLASVNPFTDVTDTSFLSALNNHLCTGGQNAIVVNGVTHRFTTGFSIVVVALNFQGLPDASSAVGVLVVPRNSANVFRFYKRAGATTWMRI